MIPLPYDRSFATRDAADLRGQLVDRLKALGFVASPRVEAALRRVPRHLFVPDRGLAQVYRDESIVTKMADGNVASSSSQPALMASVLEQLDLHPGHRVLEIGAGTGYNAALMADIVGPTGSVHTIDIDLDIVQGARAHLQAAGVTTVTALQRDGACGHSAGAPYDRIVATVATEDLSPAWTRQLAPDGRLVIPLSIRGPQRSIAFVKAGQTLLRSVDVRSCHYILLRGASAGCLCTVPLDAAGAAHATLEQSDEATVAGLRRAVAGTATAYQTGVRVALPEVATSLALWLALADPAFLTLTLAPDASACLRTHLLGRPDAPVPFTMGHAAPGSLALLTPPPPGADGQTGAVFDLWVRSFGPDASVGPRLVESVRAWDRHGRPDDDAVRVTAAPREDTTIQPGRLLLRPVHRFSFELS
jgi:protein-L-isoaspartate(D-aspartate) O-methyltransferase